jgi:hypothetical protein
MSLSLHFRLLFAYDKFLRGKGGEVQIGYVVLDHSVCWTTDPLNQLYNGSLKSSAAEILCGGSWYKFWYKIRPKTGSIFSGRKLAIWKWVSWESATCALKPAPVAGFG